MDTAQFHFCNYIFMVRTFVFYNHNAMTDKLTDGCYEKVSHHYILPEGGRVIVFIGAPTKVD